MVNLGSSQEISIKKLAKSIARDIGFEGQIIFDETKTDGTPRKIMDNKIIKEYGWKVEKNINWTRKNVQMVLSKSSEG